MQNNPAENKSDLRKRLNSALLDYQNGVRCSCGNDIWVIGSAVAGNKCFNCITGERMPTDDYEIDSAMKKKANRKEQRHINDIKPSEINGFFDDEGYEMNAHLIQKPTLCLTCINNDDPHEELFCNLTRLDQQGEPEFVCFAYKKKQY